MADESGFPDQGYGDGCINPETKFWNLVRSK
jgi:hypothetical protein